MEALNAIGMASIVIGMTILTIYVVYLMAKESKPVKYEVKHINTNEITLSSGDVYRRLVSQKTYPLTGAVTVVDVWINQATGEYARDNLYTLLQAQYIAYCENLKLKGQTNA